MTNYNVTYRYMGGRTPYIDGGSNNPLSQIAFEEPRISAPLQCDIRGSSNAS